MADKAGISLGKDDLLLYTFADKMTAGAQGSPDDSAGRVRAVNALERGPIVFSRNVRPDPQTRHHPCRTITASGIGKGLSE
jgi:hypothetical protein